MKKYLLLLLALSLLGCSADVNQSVEEEADITIEVENAIFGDALVALWDVHYPNDAGKLQYAVVPKTHAIKQYLENGRVEHDVFLVEDRFVPTLFEVSKDLNSSFQEEVEVTIPEGYISVFQKVKNTFVPMAVDGMFFAYNKYYYSAQDVRYFEQMMQADYPNAFYLDPNSMTLLNFTTLHGFDFFPEGQLQWEAFSSPRMTWMLEDFQALSQRLKLMQTKGSFDNWFMDHKYASGILYSGMQHVAYEELYGDYLEISKFPTYRFWPIQNYVEVDGYSANEASASPRLTLQALQLLRSVDGMQAYINTTQRIPAVSEAQSRSFTYVSAVQSQIAYALSDSLMMPLTSLPQDPQKTLYELYLNGEVLAVFQDLANNRLTPNGAQQRLVSIVEGWMGYE
ncbi:MAG: hypothetical protein ACRDBX_07910 [Erysipelotrichaceae bacterium]